MSPELNLEPAAGERIVAVGAPPAATVSVDLATKRVAATGAFSAEAAIAAMAAEDYPARLLDDAPSAAAASNCCGSCKA